MSTVDKQQDFPAEDAEALIGKVLEEVRSASDPALLNACRSLFRSRVPFHLRSYAAALLILRSLGVPAATPRPEPASPRGRAPGGPKGGRRPPENGQRKPESGPPKGAEEEGPETADLRIRKGTYAGDGTTLFFSMGRRQRFTAQNVLRVLSGISGIEESDIGAVRTFDNYTFVNVHPAAADLIIQDADGTVFRGRKLAVNRARPRKEEIRSGKPENGESGGDPVNG